MLAAEPARRSSLAGAMSFAHLFGFRAKAKGAARPGMKRADQVRPNKGDDEKPDDKRDDETMDEYRERRRRERRKDDDDDEKDDRAKAARQRERARCAAIFGSKAAAARLDVAAHSRSRPT